MVCGRREEADEAQLADQRAAAAVALDADDRLAIERVEVIAAKNGGQFAGEPWDVIRKILGDLISAGVNADEGEVRSALKAKEAEARLALKGA